jgi:splicing factor U2AF subunit
MAEGHQVPEDQMYIALRHFQEFYSEIFDELSNHGEIEEMFVCDNIGDHLVGNVYVKFATEGDAETCKSKITGRRYDGKMVVPEFCPVTDFREGRCRQFEDGACGRKYFCLREFFALGWEKFLKILSVGNNGKFRWRVL